MSFLIFKKIIDIESDFLFHLKTLFLLARSILSQTIISLNKSLFFHLLIWIHILSHALCKIIEYLFKRCLLQGILLYAQLVLILLKIPKDILKLDILIDLVLKEGGVVFYDICLSKFLIDLVLWKFNKSTLMM